MWAGYTCVSRASKSCKYFVTEARIALRRERNLGFLAGVCGDVVQLVRTLPRHWLESHTVTANSLPPVRQNPAYRHIYKDACRGRLTCPSVAPLQRSSKIPDSTRCCSESI